MQKLMRSKDPVEVHRAQGSTYRLAGIISMAEDIRGYQQRVARGEVKPLKKEESSGKLVQK